MRLRCRRHHLSSDQCLNLRQRRIRAPWPADSSNVNRLSNQTPVRIPAAEYTATIKPRSERGSSRIRPGVLLVLQPAMVEEPDQVFSFSSWRFLRDSLRVFGLASAKELDTAEVRLFTGKQPYMFSRRRWEAPLIEALYGNCDEP
jgi:hypothetical protein